MPDAYTSPSTTAGAGVPTAVAPPIRLGVHGSTRLASGIVTAAGHPQAQMRYVPYEVTEPFDPLRAGDMDIMIVKYDLTEPDISVSGPVGYDGRAVLVGTGHPLAGRDTVSVEEIAEYDGFQCPGDFPPYIWDLVVPPRTPGGRAIRRAHPMTTLKAMADLLRGNSAIHVSFQSLYGIVPDDIKVVPVHDLAPAPVYLASLRNTELSAHVREFVADAERSAEK